MQLTVNTSFWTRYRSDSLNPAFGDILPQAIPGLAAGQFPGIPSTDHDLTPPDHLQAIADTAASTSRGLSKVAPAFAALAQRVAHNEVLRILLSIGCTEIMHFQTWQDKAGNAPPPHRPTNGLVFPDLNLPTGSELTQTNLIMPEPTIFLDRKFPICSIIRPTETKGGRNGAAQAFIADGLFIGQPQRFLNLLTDLAADADRAGREFEHDF